MIKQEADMKLLEISHLKKSFGDLEVLRDISMDVSEGEVIAILGPSGSGKSTFLRCATMLETMDAGTMKYVGESAVTDNNGTAVYADKGTLRKLKKMKVADLQGRKGRYYFDFFKGIDELRKERGLSDKDMMQAMGLGKTKYYGMKKVTSMRYTRGDEISRLIRDLSTFMKVDAAYYLYLCIRETDNELVSEQTVEHVLRRGIVVYLTNNEIRAEMDSGEEYQLE